ncbi:hypothetical protein [Streptomyces sp. NPDC047000]|uniref:hypothetical protein n=1 Tax=Streptomyces sp. NPDC047000 TaxID=3155474 RepID=UPI0033E508D3
MNPSSPVRPEPGRWPKLEAALTVVNRDIRATLPDQDALVLMSTWDPSWDPALRDATEPEQVYVAMPDGRWQGNAVNRYDPEPDDPREPDDEETVLALVAEAAQETLMELRWQVWPVCREHRLGMYARPPGTTADWYRGEPHAAGPPVWWCRGGRDGPHDVRPVGELASALPGKERRELRRRERRERGRRGEGKPGGRRQGPPGP